MASFLVVILCGIGIRVILASEWVEKYSLLFKFLGVWKGLVYSLNVSQYSPVKLSEPGVFHVGDFLFLIEIALLVAGLFRFCISSDFVLVAFMFLGIYPFHLDYPISWCIISIPKILCYSRLGSSVSHFLYLIYLVWVFCLFFLSPSSQGFILLIFSENWLLV